MDLTINGLNSTDLWESNGYVLPKFNIKEVKELTNKSPMWVHFGAGNIFRAFIAQNHQRVLEEKREKRGIVAVEGFDYEIISKTYTPYDNLGINVILKADGTVEKNIVGSISESLTLDRDNDADWYRLEEIFKNESLQMVSFTITEKGYNLFDSNDEYFEIVVEDFTNGPSKCKSYIGKICSLLYVRYLESKAPIALVSMDNCSHNGDKLFRAVLSYAEKWCENKLVDKDFYNYINNEKYVAFPSTMIDKITPRPSESIKNMLISSGFSSAQIHITSKNTYVANFVNAEESQYLIIEDKFPNGRPNIEGNGIIFTNKETVDKVEKMKVCTCLNPLHTTLAIFGCLLGFDLISEEMKDDKLKKLVEIIGYKEGLPVVVDPIIIDPKEFIYEVLEKRMPNPFVPDTPQRIATDTSQKLAIRFGETIKAYIKDESLDVNSLEFIPLVFASWCRYLLAIDDNGDKIELSSDPMLSKVCQYLDGVDLGYKSDVHEKLFKILSDEKIFGVNLYEVGLGKKVENYFKELIDGKGAVRRTLDKYLMEV